LDSSIKVLKSYFIDYKTLLVREFITLYVYKFFKSGKGSEVQRDKGFFDAHRLDG